MTNGEILGIAVCGRKKQLAVKQIGDHPEKLLIGIESKDTGFSYGWGSAEAIYRFLYSGGSVVLHQLGLLKDALDFVADVDSLRVATKELAEARVAQIALVFVRQINAYLCAEETSHQCTAYVCASPSCGPHPEGGYNGAYHIHITHPCRRFENASAVLLTTVLAMSGHMELFMTGKGKEAKMCIDFGILIRPPQLRICGSGSYKQGAVGRKRLVMRVEQSTGVYSYVSGMEFSGDAESPDFELFKALLPFRGWTEEYKQAPKFDMGFVTEERIEAAVQDAADSLRSYAEDLEIDSVLCELRKVALRARNEFQQAKGISIPVPVPRKKRPMVASDGTRVSKSIRVSGDGAGTESRLSCRVDAHLKWMASMFMDYLHKHQNEEYSLADVTRKKWNYICLLRRNKAMAVHDLADFNSMEHVVRVKSNSGNCCLRRQTAEHNSNKVEVYFYYNRTGCCLHLDCFSRNHRDFSKMTKEEQIKVKELRTIREPTITTRFAMELKERTDDFGPQKTLTNFCL
jgi:hypothetical protein